jgi:uncharacterized protein (DUF302 family)/glutaredoxin
MKQDNRLVLYQLENCPYCQIVRKKLNLLNQPVLIVPVEANGNDRTELIDLSGQQKVPVLVDRDKVIAGSDNIIDYLEETFGFGGRQPMPSNNYGIQVEVDTPFEKTVEDITTALKNQGFGVLTEIDVKSTLKKKIDVDVPKQVILGACNPGFAHKAMSEEPDIGLLLPCNVTVRENGKSTLVTAVNPLKLLSVVGRDDLIPIAEAVESKLKNALNKIAA